MTRKHAGALGALLIGINAPTLFAGIVVPPPSLWDEGIEGELADLYNAGTNASGSSDFGNWTHVGTLPFGDATVTGSASEFSQSFSFHIDGDAVAFTVPLGESLIGLSMDHNQSLGIREFFALTPDQTGIGDVYVSRGFPINVIFNTGLNTPATSDLLALAGGALGPGTYVLSFENALRFNNQTVMDYTLTFSTTPTPGSVALLGIGMLVMARRRR